MKACIRLLFLSLVFSKIASAQKNYQPGYIVTLDKDTIQGLINYKNWEKNPKTVAFRKDANGMVEKFEVTQLDYFEVYTKDAYKRAIVWKDTKPVDLNNLESNVNITSTRDTVFLRILVNSDKLSLFELIDEKTHFYAQYFGDSVQELQYKVVLMQDDPGRYYTLNTFRDQLKKYASYSDKSLFRKIENASYSEKDLKDVISLINQSNNAGYSLSSKTEASKMQWFAGGGMTYNKIGFSGAQRNLNALRANPFTGYIVMAGLDVFGKRWFNNLFFRLELNYDNNQYRGTSEDFAQKEKTQYDIKMSTVGTHFYTNYAMIRLRNARVYAGLGFGFNFSTYPSNLYTETNTTTGYTYSKKNYLDFEKSWGDLMGQCGYIYKSHLEVNAFTRLEGSFSNFSGIGTENNMSGVALLYRF